MYFIVFELNRNTHRVRVCILHLSRGKRINAVVDNTIICYAYDIRLAVIIKYYYIEIPLVNEQRAKLLLLLVYPPRYSIVQS